MKFFLLCSVILSGCAIGHSDRDHLGGNSTARSVPFATVTSPKDADWAIRSVDFGNFDYDWYPADLDIPTTGKRIILKGGAMETEFSSGKEPRRFFLVSDGVKYGDLTGDGFEEAIVVLGMITSGTARAHLIFVYTLAQDKLKRIWVFQTGDRWDYGYRLASINEGAIIIDRYAPLIVDYKGGKHELSQSDTYVRDTYRWDGNQFVKTATEEVPVDSGDSNPWVRRTSVNSTS